MSANSTAAANPAHVAPVFAALGDATRLALVARFRAGLVSDLRQGRERIWALDPVHLEEACGCLDEISIQWDKALDRLEKFVEE